MPEGGLEPPRLAAADFKSAASTYSATPAAFVFNDLRDMTLSWPWFLSHFCHTRRGCHTRHTSASIPETSTRSGSGVQKEGSGGRVGISSAEL